MKPFRVVCVEKAKWTNMESLYPIVIGEIYTVIDIIDTTLSSSGIAYFLREADERAFDSLMFRPVDETFGEVVCQTIEEQIEYEEAVSEHE